MSYIGGMTDTITIRTDEEPEYALDVLTQDGSSRSAAIRQAVLEAARRRERAAEMRRAVLQISLGQPDSVHGAAEPGRGLTSFVTYDKRLLDAARAAGLPVGSPA